MRVRAGDHHMSGRDAGLGLDHFPHLPGEAGTNHHQIQRHHCERRVALLQHQGGRLQIVVHRFPGAVEKIAPTGQFHAPERRDPHASHTRFQTHDVPLK